MNITNSIQATEQNILDLTSTETLDQIKRAARTSQSQQIAHTNEYPEPGMDETSVSVEYEISRNYQSEEYYFDDVRNENLKLLSVTKSSGNWFRFDYDKNYKQLTNTHDIDSIQYRFLTKIETKGTKEKWVECTLTVANDQVDPLTGKAYDQFTLDCNYPLFSGRKLYLDTAEEIQFNLQDVLSKSARHLY